LALEFDASKGRGASKRKKERMSSQSSLENSWARVEYDANIGRAKKWGKFSYYPSSHEPFFFCSSSSKLGRL
jgi:hypothetical protein